jgi:hypothetical protein
VAALPHFSTALITENPQPSVNEQFTLPLAVADSIFSANTTKFVVAKNISLTAYRMT